MNKPSRRRSTEVLEGEAALNQIRCWAFGGFTRCRARASVDAHTSEAHSAHQPGDAMPAESDASSGERGVDARCPIGSAAAGVGRPNALLEPSDGLRPCRRLAPTPGVVPARGNTEYAGHLFDGDDGLIRAHEPENFPITISHVNQTAAFAKILRSSRNPRFSWRSRLISSHSSLLGRQMRGPASRAAWTTQLWPARDDGSNCRASSSGYGPARTNSVIWLHNSGTYIGLDFSIVASPSPQSVGCPRKRVNSEFVSALCKDTVIAPVPAVLEQVKGL